MRDKDIELKDFYRETSPARGTWRATSATAGYSSAARRAGDKRRQASPAGQQPGTGRRPLGIGEVTPRDTQRAKVYAAEEFVRTLFDRAAEHGNRVVDFFGTQLTLPPEGRFASAPSVQRYVDDVLAHPAVRGSDGLPPSR